MKMNSSVLRKISVMIAAGLPVFPAAAQQMMRPIGAPKTVRLAPIPSLSPRASLAPLAPRPQAALAVPGIAPAGSSPRAGGGENFEQKAAAPESPEAKRALIVEKLRAEIGRVIVGQTEMVDALIMGLIAGEHILLEGVPGVAKTQTVQALADATQGQFQRIQGTPDKLPSDILGAEILQEDPATGAKVIKFEPGPIFGNLVLVDEVNRMMPKTQAALLQAMQERNVTTGRETLALPKPFMLLATQNPIEQEGTYRLPEAQQDRFMLKVIVKRPSKEEILQIMDRFAKQQSPKAGQVASLGELIEARSAAEKVYVDPSLKGYIADLIEATHKPEAYGLDFKGAIENGASPRAAIFLLKAAQIGAFMAGRDHVTDQDIKSVAPMILGHRLALTNKAAENKTALDYVEEILKAVKVPKP